MDKVEKQSLDRVWSEIHSYESQVFGYIKNAVGNADLAKDLCQDVYLQALQKLDELDPQRSLKNWMITVARNRVINYFREHKRRQYDKLTEENLKTEIKTGDFDNAFQKALSDMPEKQKEVFILRELEGLSYGELADKLNLSESAVTSLLSRARTNFSKAYLLFFLPDWFGKNVRYLEIQDIVRFINSFESPENLLDQIQQKSQEYFAQIRGDWETIRSQFLSEQQLAENFSILGKQQNKKTLDLGSGTGFVAIHSILKGAEVTAVELNSAMLSQLLQIKENLKFSKLHLIRANINRLPVKKAQFDQIFITLVLHHVANPAGLIKQAADVIKKGGRLVVVDFKRHTNKELADLMRDMWLGFDPKIICKWASKAKLKEIHYQTWNTKKEIEVFCQVFEK